MASFCFTQRFRVNYDALQVQLLIEGGFPANSSGWPTKPCSPVDGWDYDMSDGMYPTIVSEVRPSSFTSPLLRQSAGLMDILCPSFCICWICRATGFATTTGGQISPRPCFSSEPSSEVSSLASWYSRPLSSARFFLSIFFTSLRRICMAVCPCWSLVIWWPAALGWRRDSPADLSTLSSAVSSSDWPTTFTSCNYVIQLLISSISSLYLYPTG